VISVLVAVALIIFVLGCFVDAAMMILLVRTTKHTRWLLVEKDT
jgi:hypothetical protein